MADILQYSAAPEQDWGVAERQVREYVARADRLCRERFDARAEHLLARHLLQRRQLYAHALEAGDFRTALAVLQDEAKMEGLYPETRRDAKPAAENKEADGRAVVLTREAADALVAAVLSRFSPAPAAAPAADQGGEGGGRADPVGPPDVPGPLVG